jgi:hypothetical protein
MNADGKNNGCEPNARGREFAGSVIFGLLAFALTFILLRILF